jgi:hypothetical protein
VRKALLEENKLRQQDKVQSLSKQVSSDINNIILQMQLAAAQPVMQRGELESDEATAILQQTFAEISQTVLSDGLGALDNNNILVNNGNDEHQKFIGCIHIRELNYQLRRSCRPAYGR